MIELYIQLEQHPGKTVLKSVFPNKVVPPMQKMWRASKDVEEKLLRDEKGDAVAGRRAAVLLGAASKQKARRPAPRTGRGTPSERPSLENTGEEWLAALCKAAPEQLSKQFKETLEREIDDSELPSEEDVEHFSPDASRAQMEK